jgi:hypothetical protein
MIFHGYHLDATLYVDLFIDSSTIIPEKPWLSEKEMIDRATLKSLSINSPSIGVVDLKGFHHYPWPGCCYRLRRAGGR